MKKKFQRESQPMSGTNVCAQVKDQLVQEIKYFTWRINCSVIDNDADRDGECNGNNDDHSGGDWVGCGLTDSDCKDLSVVVVKDNDGAANIDANNAKNKKTHYWRNVLRNNFFPHTAYLYYILISIYIH